MMGGLRHAWDRLSLYLPVLLMGLLALGTWWLVRNAPPVALPRVDKVERHEPDYLMKDFSVKSFAADGRLQNEVRGTVARHYPDTDTLEIDAVRLRSVTVAGDLIQGSADHALSNADGTEVQLHGNAIVVREAMQPIRGAAQPRLEFRGNFLHAWPQLERVRSDQPVTLPRGNNRFTADSMEYDNLEQLLQLRGRVRGEFSPVR